MTGTQSSPRRAKREPPPDTRRWLRSEAIVLGGAGLLLAVGAVFLLRVLFSGPVTPAPGTQLANSPSTSARPRRASGEPDLRIRSELDDAPVESPPEPSSPLAQTPKAPSLASPPAEPAASPAEPKPGPVQPPGKLADPKPPAVKPLAKPPGEPAAPAKPTPPTPPGQGVVVDYVPLPDLERATELAARSPVRLAELSGPPERCLLALRGLEFANQRLAASGRQLAVQPDAPARELAIGLAPSTDLGQFTIRGPTVEFRWAKPVAGEERRHLNWLSACVLEIQGDAGSRFVALSPRIRRGRVRITTEEERVVGNVRFEGDSPEEASFPSPVRDFPFSLGRGKVHLKSGDSFPFGGEAQSPPYAVAGLAARLGVESVSVRWGKLRPRVWQVELKLVDKARKPVDQAAIDKKITRLEQAKQALDKLNRVLVQARRKSATAERTKALKALAEQLKVDGPPEPPERPDLTRTTAAGKKQLQRDYNEALREFEEDVKATLLEPAVEAAKKLEQEIAELEKELGEGDAAKDAGGKKREDGLAQIAEVSLVLCRTIEGRIRAEDVVFGDP